MGKHKLSAVTLGLLTLLSWPAAGLHAEDWPQWGGPRRDFQTDARLADHWPDDGPPRRWTRELDDGYSAVVGDASQVCSMFRRNETEVVVALDSTTGETRWESPQAIDLYRPGVETPSAAIPCATPVVDASRVYTVGYAGNVRCLDRTSGQEIWTRDLVQDFGARRLGFGYCASPLIFEGRLLVLVGAEQCGAVALDLATGMEVWKSEGCEISYASPILLEVQGKTQFVFMTASGVMGLDAQGGQTVWQYSHSNQHHSNCATPLVIAAGELLVASHGDGASRRLALSSDGASRVTERWRQNKLGLFHNNGVIADGMLIGAQGQFLYALDIETGEVLWKQRGFAKANMVRADGKLILLDDRGKLSLVSADRQGPRVLSTCVVSDGLTWTVPSLIGTTLHVRDRHQISAYEVGVP